MAATNQADITSINEKLRAIANLQDTRNLQSEEQKQKRNNPKLLQKGDTID